MRTSFLSGLLGAGLLVPALAACSSSKQATPPTTTATSATSSTTVSETSTSTTTAVVTTVPTTASTAPAPSSVRISGYEISPATPVCNSPTMIELSWTSTGAATVDLSIDGRKFASYSGGHQSHLEYFACDGKPHTYLLTAHGSGGVIATASKVVRSNAAG